MPRVDNRRLEVVVLPLFPGAQLIDTTMVCVVRARCSKKGSGDGAALDQARRTKELRYPELSGGRLSEEAHDFLAGEGESALGAPRKSSGCPSSVVPGGALRWLAALLGRSRGRCWSAVAVVAATAKCPRLVSSSGMTVARAEEGLAFS